MKKLNKSNVEDLCNLLDTIESHVRSLENHGLNKEHFGALLIPIVQEKVPSEIRLQISRNMGKDSWKIDKYLNCMKDEIDARDNCVVERNEGKVNSIDTESIQPVTVQTLMSTIQNELKKKEFKGSRNETNRRRCVFCKKKKTIIAMFYGYRYK